MTVSRNQSFLSWALAGTVLIVLLNTWLAWHALRTLELSEYAVAHTWEVISQVEQILTSVKNAESSVRGYVNTADPSYLVPFHEESLSLPNEVDQFARLTADNPVQRARVPALRAAVGSRLASLLANATLRGNGETDALHTAITSGNGRRQMEELRQIIDGAEGEERRLLTIRKEEVRSNVRWARLTLLFASGLDLLLIFAVFQYLRRERYLRVISEETAASLALSRAEVERKSEEIHALNVALEERVRQRTAELENTNKELEAFSYSVSHDLRAPLRTIDGFSLALEEDYALAVDDTGRDYIRRVRGGVQRMGMLIDALLQLSRVTRAEIAREPVDLSALAIQVAENVRDENPGRSIAIEIDPGMCVNADPKLLRVALENLIGNAAKFTGKKEHAEIHLGWNAEQKAFYIADNGAGFDMHYAPKLFGAFNRLHGDKDFKGSGIGLATVARVIARHHGRIWAQSEVDRGATFFFTVGLPAVA